MTPGDSDSAGNIAGEISGSAPVDPQDSAFEAEVEALRQSLQEDLTLSITTTVKQQTLIAIYEEMLAVVQARDRAKLRRFLDIFDRDSDDLLSSVDAFLEGSSLVSAAQALGEGPMVVAGLERLRQDMRLRAEQLVSYICGAGMIQLLTCAL